MSESFYIPVKTNWPKSSHEIAETQCFVSKNRKYPRKLHRFNCKKSILIKSSSPIFGIFWISGMHFHGAYLSNYDIWLKDPKSNYHIWLLSIMAFLRYHYTVPAQICMCSLSNSYPYLSIWILSPHAAYVQIH